MMGWTPMPEPGLKKWCVTAGLAVRDGTSGVKLRSFLESLLNDAFNDVLIVSAANPTIIPAVRKPRSLAISLPSLRRVGRWKDSNFLFWQNPGILSQPL